MAYGKKRRGGRGSYQHRTAAKAPAAPAEPKSEAMEQLRQQTAGIDARSGHEKGFTPKPRAIRKYERFANMGD